MATPGMPDLTSRQLQTILALAEYESFIAAAALLKTSQPAVTRTVKHVEEVLGVKLFDRSTRSVQITAAGKEFVGVAGRLLTTPYHPPPPIPPPPHHPPHPTLLSLTISLPTP